jgi:hypothetical protein
MFTYTNFTIGLIYTHFNRPNYFQGHIKLNKNIVQSFLPK